MTTSDESTPQELPLSRVVLGWWWNLCPVRTVRCETQSEIVSLHLRAHMFVCGLIEYY